MEAPFKIGQRVVAIKNGTLFKEGEVFHILDLKEFSCGCWGVDVGFPSELPYSGCYEHGATQTKQLNHGIKWVNAKKFAPIEPAREHIKYVAVSETLRETAMEIAAVESN